MQAGGWNTATFCDMSGIARGAKRERDEIGDLTDDQVSKLGGDASGASVSNAFA
jgi:hypothetical protein